MVYGATQAFFSDTETSTGNIFTAGQIDLKIDHTLATYNGNTCRNDCTQLGSNLLANPSFENNTVTSATGWDIFPDGTAAGWRVEWAPGQSAIYGSATRPDPANLELHKSGNLPGTGDIPDSWKAQEGNQYAELDADWNGHTGSLNGEPALVRIYQDISTIPDKTYRISFYHSPRPQTSAEQNALKVYWDNVLQTTVDPGAGGGATSWTLYTYDFVANNSTSRIAFEGGGVADSFGVFLDNTGLAQCSLVIEGGECSLWPLKDLDTNDFFWKFNDVKPGDHGTNVISYHVYDNDSWLCALLSKEDLENEMTEPESPPDTAGEVGELSKYIEVFVWNDLDGDGYYDSGETSVANNTLLNLTNWPIAQPPGLPVDPSTPRYLGVAWCFGDLTASQGTSFTCDGSGNKNDAQTDILKEIIQFYAEQARNNPNFSCPTVLP